MPFSRSSCLAGVFAVLGCPALAQNAPPVAPEPSSTSATYGDWTTRCAREGTDGKTLVCEAVQSLVTQGQSAPVAQIALGRLAPKAPLRLTLVLPVNVAFDRMPQMLIEEQAASAVTLSWRRCAPGGCFADLEIKPETLNLWRAATKAGQIQFRNAANQDLALPFSFKGLGQALDALPKN